MTAKLVLLALAALLIAAPAQGRRMLPNKIGAGDPAWMIEKKQLANLDYARRYVRPRKHGPDPAPAAIRWYRHAARWIMREHQELEARTIGPWMPTHQCESPSSWYSRGGFEGGVQFLHSTWVANGGRQFAEHAYLATPIEQVTVAGRLTYDGWPNCPNP